MSPDESHCARPGCSNPTAWRGRLGRPRYCSRRCAAIANAAAKGREYFARLSRASRNARRARGSVRGPRPVELSLLAAGRYREAVALIYDRGYSAGWTARHLGHRQLPDRVAKAS